MLLLRSRNLHLACAAASAAVVAVLSAQSATVPVRDAPQIVLQTIATHLTSAVFLGDGSRVVTSGTTAIDIWDVRSRLKIRQIRVPASGGTPPGASAVAATPSGRMIIAAGYDGVLYAYDTDTGDLRQTVKVGSPYQHVGAKDLDVSNNGKRVIVAWDANVTLLALEETAAEPLATLETTQVSATGILCRARFTPDGMEFVAADDSHVFVGDVVSGRIVRTFTAYENRYSMQALAVSPRGSLIATSGRVNDASFPMQFVIRFWRLETGEKVREVDTNNELVTDLAFSPDGERLAVAGNLDGELSLYDVKDGRLVDALPGQSHEVVGARFDQSGRILISLSNHNLASGNLVLLHDVATGTLIGQLGYAVERPGALAIRPQGGAVAIASDRATYVLDLSGSLVRTTLRVPAMGWTQAVGWAPDGRSVLVSEAINGREPMHVFDVASGRSFADFAPNAGDPSPYPYEYPDSVAVHPDGQRIALGMQEGRVEIRRLSDYALLRVLPKVLVPGVPNNFGCRVVALAFTPDGKGLFVSANGDNHECGALRLFDVETGRLMSELAATERSGGPIAAMPHAPRLASGSSSARIRIRDDNTGQVVIACESHFDWDIGSLAFSPDGRYLYGGTQNGSVMVWNTETGAFLREQKLHDGGIDALATDTTSGLILSASGDGMLKIHSPEPDGTLTLRLTVISAGPDDYLAVTPEGYYRGSRSAGRTVAYRIGTRVVPFDQFDLQYNRPDKIVASLGKGDPELVRALTAAHQRRLRRLGLDEAAIRANETTSGPPDLSVLPIVALQPETVPAATDDRSVLVSITARAGPDASLARLMMYVNDVPAAAEFERPVAGTSAAVDGVVLSGSIFSGRLRVPLTTRYGGRNRITVFAIDSKGRQSLIETLEVACTAAPERLPTRYVVALGVSKYADGRYPLQFADKDAMSVGEMFATPPARPAGIPAARTLVLTNEDVTRAAIDKIRAFLAPAGVDDSVVFFAAGHGLLDQDGNYWFAAHDVVFDHPADGGISYDEIEAILAAVPSREKLLLLDTCHAGQYDLPDPATAGAPVSRPRPQPLPEINSLREVQVVPSLADMRYDTSLAVVEDLFANLARGSGAQIIAAASGGGSARERDGHGVFTAALLEALRDRKAAANSRAVISVSALREYLTRRVLEATGGRQTPTARRASLEFDFPIY